MAGLGVTFWYLLGSVQTSHLRDVTDALETGNRDVLGGLAVLLIADNA